MELKTKAFIGGGLVAAFTLAAGGWYGYNQTFGYSEGMREGSLTKISHKGSFCKTWEGQVTTMNIGRVNGQDNQLTPFLEFSVKDKKVAEELQNLPANSYVKLEYDQIKWRKMNALLTLSCPVDTEYVVTGFKVTDAPVHGGIVPYINATPGMAPKPKR